MQDSVRARGYTSVILALDLRQFVAPHDQGRFDRLRGSRAFAEALRGTWAERLDADGTFVPCDERGSAADQRTSSEEIGYISGIFRRTMLDEYATPTYVFQKDRITFAPLLTENLQFKELFLDVWRRWEIYVRPTMTGMLMVRLTRRYDKATPMITVAADVVRLQMVFDRPGATQRLSELNANRSDDPAVVDEKRRSIQELLRWLDRDQPRGTRSEYVPIQWKLAMEVCYHLIRAVGYQLPLNGVPISLQDAGKTTATPLYDSYVLYHIDELTAWELVVNKARQEAAIAASDGNGTGASPAVAVGDDRRLVLVTPEDIRNSAEIQRNLIQLIEGSILEKTRRGPPGTAAPLVRPTRRSTRYFPTHRRDYIDGILAQDRATWNDEVCLLAPRAAIIIPSRRAGQDALFISNFSATTGRVMYAWYWEAMERMIEFVIEIRVLAQLMERTSALVLQEFVAALSHMRSGILRRDARIDYQSLSPLIDQVANLSRMVGMCQGLSNPSVWSRAEYAVDKARYLMAQQDVPLLLDHTERNVNNLTNLLDHADELYLAALSERTNQETFWLSLVLAGLSLSITLFALPSFWADLIQLNDRAAVPTETGLLPWIATIGNVLAPLLIAGSFVIAIVATWRFVRFRTRQQRLRARRGQPLELRQPIE